MQNNCYNVLKQIQTTDIEINPIDICFYLV